MNKKISRRILGAAIGLATLGAFGGVANADVLTHVITHEIGATCPVAGVYQQVTGSAPAGANVTILVPATTSATSTVPNGTCRVGETVWTPAAAGSTGTGGTLYVKVGSTGTSAQQATGT